MNRARLALVVIVCLLAGACGKKSAPLAPFVRIPAAVAKLAAERRGSEVHVTVTIPATNVDSSLPVNIARVDVYGYTGRTAPSLLLWPTLGSVVASIPVAPAVLPPEPGAPIPLRNPALGALPDGAVTVIDHLTADELVQGPLDPVTERQRLPPPDTGVIVPIVPLPLQRFYMAIPFTDRGRTGPPGAQAGLILTPLPTPPTNVRATYTPALVTLEWEPSGGLIGFVAEDTLAAEGVPYDVDPTAVALPVVPDDRLPPGPTRYIVYRDLAPDPLQFPPVKTAGPPPSPVVLATTAPRVTTVTDETLLGRERCYTVRAARGATIGESSPPTCFAPVDIFPPGQPAPPAAVAAQGAISLIWDPNGELDLGGYLVLRREVGSATLQPALQLTATPILEARYRDATVMPGTRYSYTVIAVDARVPLPNASIESLPVEETAR